MLFDLKTDPDEFTDLGAKEEYAPQIDQMYAYLGHWGRRMAQRVTKSDADIKAMRGSSMRRGILEYGAEIARAVVRFRGASARMRSERMRFTTSSWKHPWFRKAKR